MVDTSEEDEKKEERVATRLALSPGTVPVKIAAVRGLSFRNRTMNDDDSIFQEQEDTDIGRSSDKGRRKIKLHYVDPPQLERSLELNVPSSVPHPHVGDEPSENHSCTTYK
ncbi:hypothetical protein HPB50_024686 [Hyalomma asiaticum]|uniref:Uncharacterized protein n=1 Tax=Hyalomma asiaticum TaxID=266040 RepID=A0ACB7SFL2_HYAAI|nr:hypothetical protein HPB50_024686 [Hyalomma asiaticum]